MCIRDRSSDIIDLKKRLARIIVGYTYDEKPVTAGDLKAEGAMTALLKDALKPNLVQTLEQMCIRDSPSAGLPRHRSLPGFPDIAWRRLPWRSWSPAWRRRGMILQAVLDFSVSVPPDPYQGPWPAGPSGSLWQRWPGCFRIPGKPRPPPGWSARCGRKSGSGGPGSGIFCWPPPPP